MGIYKFQPEDAERFARDRGIRTRKRGNEMQLAACPYCGSGKSRKDQYTFSINLLTGSFNCPRSTCNAKGNMLTLARDFDFSLGNDVDEYYEPRRQFRNLRKYPAPETRPEAVEYLERRGISRKITEAYSITVRKDNPKVLVFPFIDDEGVMQFIKYRNTDPGKGQGKEFCEAGCRPILFGMNRCDPEKDGTLVLTEGQIDSLSVAEAFAGNINAVSVPNGAKGFTWVPYCWDFLCKFKTLIVFGDHEHGRITLLDEMRRRFGGTVKHVRPEDYKDCKDANEILQKHGRQVVIDAVNNAVPVSNPRILPLELVRRVDIASLPRISTGIQSLDRLIGGFYFGQLIILTGERGLGKSTLGSQFIVHAVNQGYQAFCYSGELNDWMFQDWFEKQAAGRWNINETTHESGYIDYSVRPQVRDRLTAWYSGRCFIYDNGLIEYADEPEEALSKTIENAVKQYGIRVIVIDNLMTAINDNMQADFYRQQTQFVKGLSIIAKRYNALIILVAHPRKAGGFEFRNDDVAGSSNITNLADVVLRYAEPKDKDGDDDQKPDRILQVTKNRLSGRTNFDGIPLWYEAASKRISDTQRFDFRLGWEIAEQAASDAADDFVPADDYDTELPF